MWFQVPQNNQGPQLGPRRERAIPHHWKHAHPGQHRNKIHASPRKLLSPPSSRENTLAENRSWGENV